MPPSPLPEYHRPVTSQPCAWPRLVLSAIGAGQRRHAASAERGPCDPGRTGRPVPRRTGPGRLPKHRGSAAASPCGRRGGRPASCRTTCGRPGPAARHSRGDRRRELCPCTGREPGPAGRSWAGCRTAASSSTAASTADTAARRPAGRRDHAALRWWPVAVAHLLGEVLGQVADAPRRVRGSGEHALGVEPFPEPGHMPGQVIAADGIQGLIPGRQHLPGGRVDVPAHLNRVGGGVAPPPLTPPDMRVRIRRFVRPFG